MKPDKPTCTLKTRKKQDNQATTNENQGNQINQNMHSKPDKSRKPTENKQL